MIAGIFVGGASTRMRGQPKGRLLARDTGEPLIVRSARLLRLARLTPVLVGEARAYDDLLPDVPRIADAPQGVGPLGGLAGLFAFAESAESPLPDKLREREETALRARAAGGDPDGIADSRGEHDDGYVLTLACDMPFVSLELIEKLARASGDEDVLAARGAGGFWEPLCARYSVASCASAVRSALAADERSFQSLFRRLRVAELTLSESERGELCDWDAPEDLEHEP
jgi:molybdopterin-guanine dinucleotide biosynthesis protein A